ncbi:MAG: cell division protein FtsH, partial [Victivallaceae bacterium]
IIPRGQAYLGATFMMPTEDVYTHRRLELLDEMAVSMGGRVAEELVFGDITTGAAGDIDSLTRMARSMVCIYGMTDLLGPIRYTDSRTMPHIRLDMEPRDPLSPETVREIDMEIRKLVSDAHVRARNLLTQYRDQLEKLAQALLEKETMSIQEIEELLGLEVKPDPADSVVISPVCHDEDGHADPVDGNSI